MNVQSDKIWMGYVKDCGLCSPGAPQNMVLGPGAPSGQVLEEALKHSTGLSADGWELAAVTRLPCWDSELALDIPHVISIEGATASDATVPALVITVKDEAGFPVARASIGTGEIKGHLTEIPRAAMAQLLATGRIDVSMLRVRTNRAPPLRDTCMCEVMENAGCARRVGETAGSAVTFDESLHGVTLDLTIPKAARCVAMEELVILKVPAST